MLRVWLTLFIFVFSFKSSLAFSDFPIFMKLCKQIQDDPDGVDPGLIDEFNFLRDWHGNGETVCWRLALGLGENEMISTQPGSQHLIMPYLREFKKVKTIEIDSPKIKDVDYLKYFPQVEKVHVINVNNPNLSQLSKLKKLTSLIFATSTIDDWNFLTNLKSQVHYFTLIETTMDSFEYLKNQRKLFHVSFSTSLPENFPNEQWKYLPKSLPSLLITSLEVENINFLSHFPRMKDLRLNNVSHRGKAVDLAPLRKLIKLEELNLENMGITNIRPLMSLGNLRSLSLSGNKKLINIDAVAYLINLERFNFKCIDFIRDRENDKTEQRACESPTRFENIKPLENLVWLKNLQLSGNSIKDISPLKGLRNLETLSLDKNKIEDISFLKDLTRLRRLNLESNQVKALDGIENALNLQNLNINHNQVRSLKVLTRFKRLSGLKAAHNQIQAFDFVPGPKLNRMELTHNEIAGVVKLVSNSYSYNLKLGHNQIEEFEIQSKKGAHSIYLNDNKLKKAPLFSGGFRRIYHLHLQNNQVADLTPLLGVKKISILYLKGNPIEEDEVSEEIKKRIKEIRFE